MFCLATTRSIPIRRVSTAFERVGPAVAHIAAIDQETRSLGIGSGVVFTPDGYL